MTEEPKQEDRDAVRAEAEALAKLLERLRVLVDQGDEEKDNSWGKVKDFFVANATVILSLSYLYVTLIGLIYSWLLYGSFGINIFDYSQTADFLLAALKNVVAFVPAVLLGVMGLVVVAYAAISEWSIKRETSKTGIQDIQQKLDNRRALLLTMVIIVALIGLFLSLIIPFYSARQTASSIKSGETSSVNVRYRSSSGSADQVTKTGLELIGATQTSVFLYDVNDKRTLIIPQAQIVSIEVPE